MSAARFCPTGRRRRPRRKRASERFRSFRPCVGCWSRGGCARLIPAPAIPSSAPPAVAQVQERNIRRALEDAKAAARLTETEGRLSMHSLRHSWASALATGGWRQRRSPASLAIPTPALPTASTRAMRATMRRWRPTCSVEPQARDSARESASSQRWRSAGGISRQLRRAGKHEPMRGWRLLAVQGASQPFLAMQKVVGSNPIIRFFRSSTFSSKE
jgi:hypothetical protein